ncbi:MAG: contractile injection system protein, VgrG/Pvc8 family [Polyangiaceae bacterium]
MTVLVFHRLEIEGLDEELAVERWTGSARLHAPFELHVLTQKVVTDPIPLGAEAILHLATDEGYALGGVVERAEVTPEGTLVVMVPPVARLAHCRNHRVVLEIDGLTLAKDVIAEHSLSVESRCGATPAPRPQRVQAFETDLGYAARLLAEEGMTWFCDQDGQGATSIVFVDGPSGHAPIVGDAVVPYRPESGLLGAEAIEELRLSEQWTVDRFQVRDYCYETPSVDLTTEVGEGPHGAYRFVGPGRYKDGGAGQALAQRLLEVEQREATLLEATSSCHRLWPGRTFELGDAPRDDLGGEWLVIEATYEGQTSNIEAPRVAVRFKAIPATAPGASTVEPAPTMGGVQTATITGPAGEGSTPTTRGGSAPSFATTCRSPPTTRLRPGVVCSIHRRTGASCCRAPAGRRSSASRDSGDEPYVLGRLDNGSAPTAESLPGKQICSNFGTPTTPAAARRT